MMYFLSYFLAVLILIGIARWLEPKRRNWALLFWTLSILQSIPIMITLTVLVWGSIPYGYGDAAFPVTVALWLGVYGMAIFGIRRYRSNLYALPQRAPAQQIPVVNKPETSLPVWALDLPKHKRSAIRVWLDEEDEATVYRRARDEGWLVAPIREPVPLPESRETELSPEMLVPEPEDSEVLPEKTEPQVRIPEPLPEEPAFPPQMLKPNLPNWADNLTPLKQELVRDELKMVNEDDLHARLENLGWFD